MFTGRCENHAVKICHLQDIGQLEAKIREMVVYCTVAKHGEERGQHVELIKFSESCGL